METIESFYNRLEHYKVSNPRPYLREDDEYSYYDAKEHTYCNLLFIGEGSYWKNPTFAVKGWTLKEDYLEISVYNIDVLAGHGYVELRNTSSLDKWIIVEDNPVSKLLYVKT